MVRLLLKNSLEELHFCSHITCIFSMPSQRQNQNNNFSFVQLNQELNTLDFQEQFGIQNAQLFTFSKENIFGYSTKFKIVLKWKMNF